MIKHTYILLIIGAFTISFMANCNTGRKENAVISDSLRDQCIQELRKVMNTQSDFVKVHAAEYLLWSGNPKGVLETFREEEKQFDTVKPYRIGIWRVLAQADTISENENEWIDKIMKVFVDTNAVDRVNAVETLAKLGVSPLMKYPQITRTAMAKEHTSLSIYTRWAASLSNTNKDSINTKLLGVIQSKQSRPLQRTLAAYILRHINKLNEQEWKVLSKYALSEKDSSPSKAYLLSAAYITAPKDAIGTIRYVQIKKEFLQQKESDRAGSRMELAMALAVKGNKTALPILISLLNNKNPLPKETANADVSAAAAYAILEMGE